MLTNRIIFARLMALLRSINPAVPLPDFLEPYLWKNMDEEPITKKGRVLEERFEKHRKAYYVVTGFVDLPEEYHRSAGCFYEPDGVGIYDLGLPEGGAVEHHTAAYAVYL